MNPGLFGPWRRGRFGAPTQGRKDSIVADILAARDLCSRYVEHHSLLDLEVATALYERCLQALPSRDPRRTPIVGNFAMCLHYRYAATGERSVLDAALGAYEEVLASLPSDHPARADYLTIHADALIRRFDLDGNAAALDDAIAQLEEAVTIAPDNPQIKSRQNKLAIARLQRANLRADEVERAVAITTLETLTSDSASTDPIPMLNRAAALTERYRHHGDIDDLARAGELYATSLPAVPLDSPLRATFTANHSRFLITRFLASHNRADLHEAVTQATAALALTPKDSPQRPQHLCIYSEALRIRFEATAQMADIDQSIDCARAAVSETRPRTRPHADAHTALGRALVQRYQTTHSDHDIAESVVSALEVIDNPAAFPQDVAATVDSLIRFLHAAWPTEPPNAGLIDLVPGIMKRALEVMNQSGASHGPRAWGEAIGFVQGLTAQVAYTAAQRDPALAVEILEAGVAVLAGARLPQQEAVLNILRRRGEEEAVTAYLRALSALPTAENPGEALEEVLGSRATVEELWGEPLVGRATPSDQNRLVADGAPLTYLVSTDEGGLALTLTHQPNNPEPHVTVTWLPQLASAATHAWVDTLTHHGDLSDTTDDGVSGRGSWRGASTPDVAAIPHLLRDALVPALPIMGVACDDQTGSSRARLVPVGALNTLPWTAALNTGGQVVAVSVAASGKIHDLVARRRPLPPPTTGGLAAITNPHLSTWRHTRTGPSALATLPLLPSASDEGTWLALRYKATHIDGADATLTNVTNALADTHTTAAHFATHGDAPHWDPTHTHLILTNPDPGDATGPADSITTTDLPTLTHIDHVFLASCWSATSNSSLPDENQSLPTTFMTTGTRTVIAPLWPVHDDATNYLVRRYHRYWLDRHEAPALALAHAIHDTWAKSHTLPPTEALTWQITANAFNTYGGAVI